MQEPSGGPIRVGIAGLGRFGKLHARILHRMSGVTIAAVCDPVETEREAAKAQFGIANAYAELADMLESEALDCVFLITPEQLHGEQLRLTLAKGLPTFVEKPLATTSAEGEALVGVAREAGVHVQVGFVLRFETQHAMLKDQIGSGRFGDIVTLRLKRNCSRSWFQIYGDRAHSVHETIIHDIDLAVWLTGSRATKVYAVSRNISGLTYPDATMAIVQFENGTMCTMETSWLIPDRAPANVLTDTWHGTIDAELEAIGTRQSARVRLLESTLNVWSDEITNHPEAGLWPEVYGEVAGALRAEDEHFIDCVRNGTTSPIASVEQAVEGLRIAEAIMLSAAEGREITLR